MQAAKLLAASGTATKLFSEDVFSATTYVGNDATQTITNGIDLAGKGGMVWIKGRGTTAMSHAVYDTARGAGTGPLPTQTKTLGTSLTDAEGVVSAVGAGVNADYLSAFTSTGFTVVAAGSPTYCKLTNGTGGQANGHVSWTFRKAPKFFDVVTYTGDGTTNKTISHSLGSAPGMIIVKDTSGTSDWCVYHRSATTHYNGLLQLNTTAAYDQSTNIGIWGTTLDVNASTFNVGKGAAGGGTASTNINGRAYIAYLFAHDTATDGLIQCGSLPTSGSVTLGWEPQFVLWKDAPSGWWYIYDTARGFTTLTSGVANGASLNPNNSNAESFSTPYVSPNPTGFTSNGATGATSIYLAIRRPNKPPTTGTQVYNAIARTGTGAAATVTGVGFAPDLVHIKRRTAVDNNFFGDRLRGSVQALYSDATAAEAAFSNGVVSLGMDGMSLGTGTSVNATDTIINHFFKRAPGCFDIVCYTGTGAATTVSHGLGSVPELIITKGRSGVTQWWTYAAALGNNNALALQSTSAASGATDMWNTTSPTSSVFSLGNNSANTSTVTYVACLFATLAGISKVGSYTGNGSSQTIACGFTTGARFVMIKRTDSTGDWYVWDTVRGIVAGNDPRLSLNTTSAEVTTDDSIDPNVVGFDISQLAATNINVTSATYIFLALA